MAKIKCDRCKEESNIAPYFHRYGVIKDEDPVYQTVDHYAFAQGRVICPYCGSEIIVEFKKALSRTDIIELALEGTQR